MNRAEKRRQNKLVKKAAAKALGPTHKNLSHLFTTAVQYHQSGQLKEAEALYQKILGINPNLSEAHCNLGSVQNELGKNTAAERSYRHAISLKPDYADAHGNLGNALSAMDRLEEAIACYEEALTHKPKGANLHNSLGGALQELGRHSDAITCFVTALSFAPEFTEAHSNLGISLKETNRFDEALKSYESALSIRPDFSEAHSNKGNVLKDLGRLDEASACYRQALAIRPDYAEARCNLGGVLTSMGKLEEALNCYERTLADKPGHRLAANNYLHTLLYQTGTSNDDLFNACLKIANNRKPANDPIPLPTTDPEKGERIRIGYISSDFREHPLGNNVMPLIANHDHQKYEVFCYAELSAPDNITNKFQKHADHWRMIKGLTDIGVAEHIRADRIHVLLYLGGHFDENRPGIAAYRAAPVQVAMYGGTTTALDTMDYWLSDHILHPEGEGDEAEKFTETIWRLPNFYNFTIPTETPDVSPLPARTNGYVTFVSFNKPCKMNDDVLDLWSGVLNAVPGSRLILKFRNYLSDAAVANPILERFAANGITNDRIELAASIDNFNEHLTHYNQGDIALDTFPFSGATTTFQALWMGLPVVSLHGERFISRMGESICQHAGLDNLCAATPEDYIKVCASLAKNLDHLSDLRLTLRDQVTKSPLCDGAAYARNIETAYENMVAAKNKIQL